jgi:hypothetical protein
LLEYTQGSRATELPHAPGYRRVSGGGGLVRSATADTWYSHNNASGSHEYAGRLAVSVGDRDVNGVVVPLRRAVTMTGRVVLEGFTPDPALRAVPTTIQAEPAYGNATLGIPSVWVSSGDRAEFRLTGLMAGEYALSVSPPEGHVKSIVWAGRDYAGRAFDAGGGQDFNDVVITLTKAEARISGAVRDAQGRSAAGAHVLAFPADPALRMGYGFTPRRFASRRASSAAAFSIGPLPAGDYFVVALSEPPGDRALDPSFLEAAARSATRVSVVWGQTTRTSLVVTSVRGSSRQ